MYSITAIVTAFFAMLLGSEAELSIFTAQPAAEPTISHHEPAPSPLPVEVKPDDVELLPPLEDTDVKSRGHQLVLTPIATQVPAKSLRADDVVAKVQDVYKKTQKLTANFTQTYNNVTFGRKSVSQGKIWLKKPGKMRWDYKGKKSNKVRKSFISDGETLWAVEHNNKQVFRKSLKNDVMPVIVSFLLGTGDLSKEYKATLDTSGKYSKKDYVLMLVPKINNQNQVYKKLYLVADPTDFKVKKSIVIEATGNVNQLEFFNPNTDKVVKDAWFAFDEKTAKARHYRIIDKTSK